MAFILTFHCGGIPLARPLSAAETEALQAAADQLEAHSVTTNDCEYALARQRQGMDADPWTISVWEAAEEAAQLLLESFNVRGNYMLHIEWRSSMTVPSYT